MSEIRNHKEDAQIFIRWMIKVHPKILDEYFKSAPYKALQKNNLRSSAKEAMELIEKINPK